MTTGRRHRRREASEYLREKWNLDSSEGSLANHACKGTGPEYRLIGGLAHYEEPALDSWAISRISPPIRKASEARNGAQLYEANLPSGKAGAAGTTRTQRTAETMTETRDTQPPLVAREARQLARDRAVNMAPIGMEPEVEALVV